VALAEPGDRRVIRLAVTRDHPERDIIHDERSTTREDHCPLQ
jgi:hypothetical protein